MEKKLPYVFQKYKNYKEEIDPNVTRNEWKTLKQNYKNANNPFFLYKKTQETPGESLAQVNVYPEFDNLPELTRIKSKRNAASQADVYVKTQKQFENTYNNYVGSLVASGMTEEDADERFWSDYYPNSEMKKLNDEVEFQQRYVLSGPHGEEPIETVSPFLSYIYPPTAMPKYIADETTDLLTGNQSFGNYASNMAEMVAPGFFGRIKGAGQAAKEAWKKSAPVKETPPPPKNTPKPEIPNLEYDLNQNFLLGSAEEAKKYADVLNKKGRIPYGATRKHGNGKGSFWFGNISSDAYVSKNLLDPKQVVEGLTEKDFKTARKTQAFKNSIGKDANPKDYYKINLEKLLTAESPQFGNSKLYDQILAQIKQTKYGADVNKAGINLYYNPNTMRLHQHMLPFAAGNVREGRPFMKQLGSVVSSTTIAPTAIVGIPTGIGAIISKQKQYHDWLNSANQLSNEGWLFQSYFNDYPDVLDELNSILDSYKSNPNNEKYKYYMEQADKYYKDIPGYENYKRDYLNNN